MKTLKVNTEKSYNIFIENGLLEKIGELICEKTTSKKLFVISDSNVFPIYGDKLIKTLKGSGFDCFSFVFSAGESSKRLSVVEKILEEMASEKFNRNDSVIALGGGVTGDMAGLSASLYMRGIKYFQVPTSLLAQVDSSVGGKTAVDLVSGKNLCGTFHQPTAVFIDTSCLETLPKKFMVDGMAEVIKYACIRDLALFEKLDGNGNDDFFEDMIYQCVNMKKVVVENDEKEHGERKILNFGHTFGHAIEKYYNYERYSHGEAVSIGMVIASEFGEKQGITKIGTTQRIVNLLKKYELPTETDAPMDALEILAQNDKKCSNNGIELVVLNEIGNAKIDTITLKSCIKE